MNKPTVAQGDEPVNTFFGPLDKFLAIAEKAEIVFDPARAKEIVNNLPDECALDFETTGLSPTAGAEVRLTCLYAPEIGCVILDHFSCGPFSRYADSLANSSFFYVYNAKFEASFFDYYVDGDAFQFMDVDFLAKAKLGGHPSSFARMCQRDLRVSLDKTLQTSDWSMPALTDNQYIYGGLDAVLTWALREYWDEELNDAQWEAATVFNDAVRATIECEQSGLYLDKAVHQENIDVWQRKHAIALAVVRRYTPSTIIKNLRSNKQVSDYLKENLDKASIAAWPTTGKREYLSLERKTLKPIQAKAPWPFSRWLIAFMQMRYYEKYLSTYGESLLHKQRAAGKVQSRFNIGQAATGRYSSSDSNLQNIPRKPLVRRAFTVSPRVGEVMVMADYSGIELRVLAEISGDEQLKHDVIYGNVHASSAATIYRIAEDQFLAVYNDKTHPLQSDYKEKRSVAKGFSFQLTYGAMAPSLSIVLKCSIEEAEDAIRQWAKRYPKAYHYRQIIFEAMDTAGFIPVVDGRTIYVRKPDRTMPVAANYGIQGAAASVMYRAMYHVRNEYRKHMINGRLAATVHDELLTYVTASEGDEALACLVRGMERGWLDIFPDTSTENLIEAVIGTTWADKP